jgi:hypothetical protein
VCSSDLEYTVELSLQSMDATASSEQSVLNSFKYSMNHALEEFSVIDDIIFHTAGDGILTNPASANGTWTSGDTYTFAATTDTIGVNRLRPGMGVQSYDVGGTALNTEATDPMIIHSIDWDNKVVNLTGAITGEASGASGDIFVYPGVSGATASFGASWPLSGDSFRHGLYYAHDATTSYYYLGKLKSDNRELMPNVVDASSSGLTFAHVQSLLDKIVMRRSSAAFKGLIGLANMNQRAAAQNIGVSISEWFRGKKDDMIDIQPSNTTYESTFQMCGLTVMTDKRQNRDRIDFIIPKNWGRAYLRDTGFYQVGGRQVYEGRASTGAMKATQFFKLISAFDYFCYDPGVEGYISGLAV